MASENSDQSADSRKINTFVFLDLETSDLLPIDKPKILELCMVAIHRTALSDSVQQDVPRVLDKITICFNPNKQVSPKSFELTGLDNFNIADSGKSIFDEDAVKLMQLFLRRQQQPVCLVAHNGDRFDFRLLRTELRKINQSLGEDVLCADSLLGFYETDQEDNSTESPQIRGIMTQKPENLIHASPAKRSCPDVTPEKQTTSSSQYVRMMPYSNNSPSYSLANIYKRTFAGQSLSRAHNAEGDVNGTDPSLQNTRGEAMSLDGQESCDAY